MANSIKNIEQRITALCEIAKIDPQGFQEAKDLVAQLNDRQNSLLLEIAKAEALQNDFTSALITANGMRSGKIEAFVELAKIAAQHNLEAAKTCAYQIEDPKTQALVQFEIAIIDRDPISASKWVDRMAAEEILDGHFKKAKLARAYIKIAKLDRSLAYAKAKECIGSLRTGYEKVELLAAVAALDENPNFAEAKQEAELAPFSSMPNVSRLDFFETEMNYDQGGDYQFAKIASAEAKYDVEAAKATADKIVASELKEKTINDIEMIGKDTKVAASEVLDPFKRALAFIESARIDSLHDLSEAKESVCRIKTTREFDYSAVLKKVTAICAIAEVIQVFPMDRYVWQVKIPPKAPPKVSRKGLTGFVF